MSDIGIMMYGYGLDDATFIHESLEEVLGEELDLVSATNQEETVVSDILERGDSVNFEDRDVKVLMVLGFSEEQLEVTLRGFPKKEGLVSPIFCVLTKDNLRWPLLHLIEDLQAERAAFLEMRRQQMEQGQ